MLKVVALKNRAVAPVLVARFYGMCWVHWNARAALDKPTRQ